jgi:thiamine biosynthesis protein ThiC
MKDVRRHFFDDRGNAFVREADFEALQRRFEKLFKAAEGVLDWDEQVRTRLHKQQFEIYETETPLPEHSERCPCALCGLKKVVEEGRVQKNVRKMKEACK